MNCIALAACGLLLAGSATAAQAQKLEYDCDTQAEHYSVLKAVQDGPNYAAGGTISLRDIVAVKKYATLGRLVLEARDKSWRAQVSLLAVKAGKDVVLTGQLEIFRGDQADAPQDLGSILEYQPGKPYPIRLQLGPDGGSATLGDHVLPVKLPARGKAEASVICSGGEFLFTDLDLAG